MTRERLQRAGTYLDVPASILDVPETIPQLGYGSHQFFRYYGKFPSVVGAAIVGAHATRGEAVLDCYAGSGTTLVEAQNAGHPSFGLDLNPLAVLASRVKTAYVDAAAARAALSRVYKLAAELLCDAPRLPRSMSPARLDKWFTPSARGELAALRDALLAEPEGLTRDFLLTAYLGVVRRVSTAYDGEVRPHVNPRKRPRSPFVAFKRKAVEMIERLADIAALRSWGVPSACHLGDNREPEQYRQLLSDVEPSLVVAHPPYLNSFNYFAVFSLEFAWAEDFAELFEGTDLGTLRLAEHLAHPATNSALVTRYYDDFRRTIVAASAAASPCARIAVVIGDATIRGEVEPVHARAWQIMQRIGLKPIEVWFRTTHYGIGKYAYKHRADYHGDETEKKDAILFFEKA